MEKSLSEQMADNLAYYVNDPKKRCANDNDCYYSGKTINKKTQGCFVGRLLTPEDRLKADSGLESGSSGVSSLIANSGELGIKIPKVIKDNERLMNRFQKLHDCNEFWTETGLSDEGKTTLYMIIDDFGLEEKFFEKFLVD